MKLHFVQFVLKSLILFRPKIIKKMILREPIIYNNLKFNYRNKLNQIIKFSVIFLLLIIVKEGSIAQQQNAINLAGKWKFQIDSLNVGINQKWFNQNLKNEISLPGSMTTNGIGNNVKLNTIWTGDILDSSYYKKPEYEKYRQPNNIKIPFWLQPVKYYKGVAWYQKTIVISKELSGKKFNLYLERPHWQTNAWVDGENLGSQNSLGIPHQFEIKNLKPGTHTITIRIDNGVNELKVGQDSHSISDNTQGNWNGIIGRIELIPQASINIKQLQIYPDVEKKQLLIKMKFNANPRNTENASISLQVSSSNNQKENFSAIVKNIKINTTNDSLEVVYPMGENLKLWDEFNPNLYSLNINLKTKNSVDSKSTVFGMRDFKAIGTQLTLNGKPVFLRGTLDCAAYPLTGYPPTDEPSWIAIFKKIKSYGLNHVRYHSWTPPEAAFDAADKMGVYLQVECSSWANGDARIGEGLLLDKYIYEESDRLMQTYGNHPSFMMMAYGNEPRGKDHVKYLTDFVKYWQMKDKRRLYTTGAGWPVVAESDYNNPPDPRIQRWGEGLKSIINAEPPKSNYTWEKRIAKWKQPTISHEIGQWCVYPDFKEIKEYSGILKPKNFEIFEDRLKQNNLYHLADSFLLASGKLQVLCYKADIEAALRTPGFGGFQLLGLSDFPGQGTALVGVLNAFWKDKGYVNGEEFSQFCNANVPLALFPKFIYYNNEKLNIPVKLAYYGDAELSGITPIWTVKDENGNILFSGKLAVKDIQLGNNIDLGNISQELSSIKTARKLKLTINVANAENTWDFFVYPKELPGTNNDILITQQLDKEALNILNKGGKVLLTFKKGNIKPEMGGNVKIGFSSIFWNTSYTSGQAPNTLGILCNPNHPALASFPTDYHSNWQWWDAMSHSNAIRLDAVSKNIKPIVRVVDDWYTANSLGLIFECKVGKGKLLVSGIDLLSDNQNRPEAIQLLYSLKKYMAGGGFNPDMEIEIEKIIKLKVQ